LGALGDPESLWAKLWAHTESERLVRMAINRSDLLSYDEVEAWRVIEKTKALWDIVKGSADVIDGKPDVTIWGPPMDSLGMRLLFVENKGYLACPNLSKIEACWKEIQVAAEGDPKPLEERLGELDGRGKSEGKAKSDGKKK
jgi:hypothetical protein